MRARQWLSMGGATCAGSVGRLSALGSGLLSASAEQGGRHEEQGVCGGEPQHACHIQPTKTGKALARQGRQDAGTLSSQAVAAHISPLVTAWPDSLGSRARAYVHVMPIPTVIWNSDCSHGLGRDDTPMAVTSGLSRPPRAVGKWMTSASANAAELSEIATAPATSTVDGRIGASAGMAGPAVRGVITGRSSSPGWQCVDPLCRHD